jgi:hypothetical protein
MAFPEVTLKDALDGPNGDLSANWTTPAFPTDSSFVLFGGHAAPSERPASATYSAAQHTANADVTIKVFSGCESPATVELLLRMDLESDGYRLEFAPSGASMNISLYRASTGLMLDSTVATGGASIPAGAQIGARLVDNTVTPYIDFVGDGVTWTAQTALATDGEVTGAGYAGFRETPGGGS